MCEICRSYPCHPRCPNYIPPKASHYCSICKEGIYDGEEYIENDYGKYAHWDCIENKEDLLDFLDKSINIVSDDYEY